jgi:antitoxin (DNA-binding transcriptional repressor) of toxin-antitoxin stability system
MATIHISLDKAIDDIKELISRASKGDEIVIENGSTAVARLMPPKDPRMRTLSETLRILEERGSNVTLDDEFGRDLTDIINSRREPLFNPDNDPWA